MDKTREELLIEMQKNLAKSDNSFLTEVAMPGCKADAVNPSDIDH